MSEPEPIEPEQPIESEQPIEGDQPVEGEQPAADPRRRDADSRRPDGGPSVTAAGPRPRRTSRRRAALISTAIAVPVTVLAALAFTAGRDPSSASAPPPPLTEAAIPANPGADSACTRIVEKLPVTLSSLAPRRVFSTSTYIVAWGDPAVVLRCGVARPAGVAPGSSDQFFGFGSAPAQTVYWLVQTAKSATTFTAVDRSVYVEVLAPKKYSGDSLLTPLSDAIAAALPRVCQASADVLPTVDRATLCVNRK